MLLLTDDGAGGEPYDPYPLPEEEPQEYGMDEVCDRTAEGLGGPSPSI